VRAIGAWDERFGHNGLDTGGPNYDTYETKDGKFISLGSLEPQFYAEFLARTGLDQEELPAPSPREGADVLRARFTELFLTKTRDEWCELLEGTDVCFAPVLPMSEAAEHPHIKARGTIVEYEGVLQPAPAPRFSRTPGEITRPRSKPGQHTDEVLTEWGFTADEVAKLREIGAVA